MENSMTPRAGILVLGRSHISPAVKCMISLKIFSNMENNMANWLTVIISKKGFTNNVNCLQLDESPIKKICTISLPVITLEEQLFGWVNDRHQGYMVTTQSEIRLQSIQRFNTDKTFAQTCFKEYNGRCNRSIKLNGLRMRLPMLNPRYRHSPNHHQTDENPRLPNQQHRQLGQSLHVIWSAIEKYHTYQGENTLFVKTTGAEKSFMIVVLSKLMEGKVTFVVLEQVKEQVWITLQYVTAEYRSSGEIILIPHIE